MMIWLLVTKPETSICLHPNAEQGEGGLPGCAGLEPQTLRYKTGEEKGQIPSTAGTPNVI